MIFPRMTQIECMSAWSRIVFSIPFAIAVQKILHVLTVWLAYRIHVKSPLVRLAEPETVFMGFLRPSHFSLRENIWGRGRIVPYVISDEVKSDPIYERNDKSENEDTLVFSIKFVIDV